MNISTKAFVVAATVGLGSVTGANAALLDFTTDVSGLGDNNGLSGSITAATWTLTPDPAGQLTINNPDGPGPIVASPLEGTYDGLGVTDDEISGGSQSITITFSRQVVVSALYFLDLFKHSNGKSLESAIVTVDGDKTYEFFAGVPFSYGTDNFGFLAATGLSIKGTTFTFTPGAGNDNEGARDFALAGIEAAVIPLPAGVLLLGTALAGLGIARRRKAA